MLRREPEQALLKMLIIKITRNYNLKQAFSTNFWLYFIYFFPFPFQFQISFYLNKPVWRSLRSRILGIHKNLKFFTDFLFISILFLSWFHEFFVLPLVFVAASAIFWKLSKKAPKTNNVVLKEKEKQTLVS